ncbi:MAG: phage portal protein [Pseudomonadota bacterium]
MKLWPFGRKAPTRKSLGMVGDVTPGGILDYALGEYGRMSSREAMRLYRRSSAVAISVDTIADEIQSIRPVLEMPDGTFEQEHEVLEFLRRPNAHETYEQFIGQLARHWLLTHDAFLLYVGNVESSPAELYAVKPQVVTLTESSDEYASSIFVTEGMGASIYPREIARGRARYLSGRLREVVHIRGFSSRTEQTYSDSPLEAAALDARQQILGREHNLALLRNGARLSLVVVFKDVVGADEEEARKNAVQAQLGGAQNAGKVAVMSAEDGDYDMKEVGQSNKDMDFAQLQDMANQAVYQRYKIPLPLVSEKASTFNNMEQAVFHLYDRAVLPNANTLFSGLSRSLLPRYRLDPSRLRITYNPESIPALMTRRLEELERRRKIGVESINEGRSLLGREPIENGDGVYLPANMVEVGRDIFTIDNDRTPEDLAEEIVDG